MIYKSLRTVAFLVALLLDKNLCKFKTISTIDVVSLVVWWNSQDCHWELPLLIHEQIRLNEFQTKGKLEIRRNSKFATRIKYNIASEFEISSFALTDKRELIILLNVELKHGIPWLKKILKSVSTSSSR